MASKGWQNQERLVASWFGTMRNPLSGRNNIADDGSRRLGDIIHPHAMVEVKRRKTTDMSVGISTRALAKTRFMPWAVYEFKTARSGSAPEASMVKITVDHATAEAISAFLNDHWTIQKLGGLTNGLE